MACISELVTYPVKGCAGVSTHDARMTEAGLTHDRSFLVITPDGTFRSQRRSPKLALIRPGITSPADDPGGDAAEQLTLDAAGMERLRVPVDLTAPRRDVTLFGAPYQGIDQGAGVAEWLSEALGEPSRLVRVPPEHRRIADGMTPGTSAYADSNPVHLLSVRSLDGLNERLLAGGDEPLPMTRFRPNIVVDGTVDGWERPHREDALRLVRAGDAELAYAKLAIRCVVTTVDQSSGTKSGPEPLRTLAGYRRATATGGTGVAFGVKLSVLRPGKLSVGDELTVDEWGTPEV
ncbi:MOSC domain-containing protein [Streptomyces oceani]|uniref:Molybdenum cofactor sulfurase n=1 Tax=Streptomyces oceani TaxID=1075402 RepID=A0A1E7JXR9_9ACTN|nr:MOSC N-terminal beta barrel domain-containing protein [Streptomyces oceani]OEU96410.1 molybdenum cofactor sulfurase [Streptomyces oceani]